MNHGSLADVCSNPDRASHGIACTRYDRHLAIRDHRLDLDFVLRWVIRIHSLLTLDVSIVVGFHLQDDRTVPTNVGEMIAIDAAVIGTGVIPWCF